MGAAHVPERTCVGCRERGPKSELIRFVVSGGRVLPDVETRRPGRGAYVHRSRACLDAALAMGSLGRALRIGLDRDGAATLRADIEGDLAR